MDTRYSAARFLSGEPTQEVSDAFVQCWVTIYVGFPDVMEADQGSLFTSKLWNENAAIAGVAMELTPIEISGSMGIGERCQDPLRRIFLKAAHADPGHGKEMVLSIAK